MHNSVEVVYQRGVFNVIGSVNLETRDTIMNISTAKEANKLALDLVEKYEKGGHHIETVNLW